MPTFSDWLGGSPRTWETVRMGYELHITKASDWVDATAHPIDERTWLALAAGSFRLDREGSSVILGWPVRRGNRIPDLFIAVSGRTISLLATRRGRRDWSIV